MGIHFFIGQVVLYHSRGSADGVFKPEPRAAMITGIKDEDESIVDLVVFNPTGLFFNQDVPYSEYPDGGYWSEVPDYND